MPRRISGLLVTFHPNGEVAAIMPLPSIAKLPHIRYTPPPGPNANVLSLIEAGFPPPPGRQYQRGRREF
jgi:hypothetical protein